MCSYIAEPKANINKHTINTTIRRMYRRTNGQTDIISWVGSARLLSVHHSCYSFGHSIVIKLITKRIISLSAIPHKDSEDLHCKGSQLYSTV